MSKLLYLSSEIALREQAGAWLAKLDRGLSVDEQAELRQWLAQSSKHRTALFELAELWDRMEVLGEISELFPLESRAPHPFSRYAWPVAALVSIIVLFGFAVGPSDMSHLAARTMGWFTRQPHDAVYRTAVGEQKSIHLPDRSIVTLNTDTVLRVHYTDADRQLELLQGEAHFKVSKDAYRVFTVKVAENEFKAVGTAFNIRMGSARGIELTVTEGRVKVIVPFAVETVRRPEKTSAGSITEIMVDAGKEVAVDHATQTIERLQPARMEAALAWQHGMLVFDGDPLEEVVQELSRYSKIKFIIEGERIKRTPVTGYFMIGDIDGLIAALHANFDIDARRNGEAILLSAN